MINLYKSLLKAQEQIGAAVKDAKNPHFKSKYETLESVIEAIKKPLNDNGLVVLHQLTRVDDRHFLVTKIIHADSGEHISSECDLILQKNDMQQMGSAQTYAKRQNLKALTNLPSEDDDGNAASQPQNQKTQPSKAVDVMTGNPFDDYTINAGPNSKLTGTKLKDHSPEFLLKTVESSEKWHKDNNKTPHKNTKEFSEMVHAYLKHIDFLPF